MPLKTVFISGIPEPTHNPLTHHIIMNIFDSYVITYGIDGY